MPKKIRKRCQIAGFDFGANAKFYVTYINDNPDPFRSRSYMPRVGNGRTNITAPQRESVKCDDERLL